jgi:rare lipoprotein A (peptidoglycan hydrolase)
VSASFAQRGLALAGVALLAVIVALALISRRGESTPPAQAGPQPVTVAGTGWYSALAGVASTKGRTRTACGVLLTRATLGVAHPVLPCGAKLFLWYGGVRVLTQVIDRGPAEPGQAFDLTPALAKRLGLRRVGQIRWTFARA